MMIPTVHMNGSGKELLTKQLELAYRTIDSAINALADAYPHGRDYYPQGDDAIVQAIVEHHARINKLRDVRDEIEALWQGVVDQGR